MRTGQLTKKRSHHILWFSVSVLLLNVPSVQASSIVFDDSADFFAVVGPTVAFRVSDVPDSPAFAGLPFRFDDGAFPFPGGATSFEIHEAAAAFNSLTIADFSPRYPGNEIAVRGAEEIDALAFGFCSGGGMCVPTPVFFSIGFNIVEPRFDAAGAVQTPDSGSPFVDSLFLVTLMDLSGNVVDSFVFNAPDDASAFVGVWSSEPIGRATIRELTDDPGDELFGDVFVGTQRLDVVPEPSSIVLLTTGLVGLLRYRYRHIRRENRTFPPERATDAQRKPAARWTR